jgi:hypothetical protein
VEERRETACYVLERISGYGRVGHGNSYGGSSGVKIHRLSGERVVGYANGFQWKPGYYKIGDVYSCRAVCNGNGQHTGRIFPKLTAEDVTCQNCGAPRKEAPKMTPQQARRIKRLEQMRTDLNEMGKMLFVEEQKAVWIAADAIDSAIQTLRKS